MIVWEKMRNAFLGEYGKYENQKRSNYKGNSV